MIDLNQFFRHYRSSTFKCRHLAWAVWAEITGEDLPALMAPVGSSIGGNVAQELRARRIERPVSPCVVLMQRQHFSPHVGIFYEDRVMHLGSNGVLYQPLDIAARGFTKLRFYK